MKMPEYAYYDTFSAERIAEFPSDLVKQLVLGNFARQCMADKRWNGTPIKFAWNVSAIDGSVMAGASFEFEESK